VRGTKGSHASASHATRTSYRIKGANPRLREDSAPSTPQLVGDSDHRCGQLERGKLDYTYCNYFYFASALVQSCRPAVTILPPRFNFIQDSLEMHIFAPKIGPRIQRRARNQRGSEGWAIDSDDPCTPSVIYYRSWGASTKWVTR
jgi:hypothetical protein